MSRFDAVVRRSRTSLRWRSVANSLRASVATFVMLACRAEVPNMPPSATNAALRAAVLTDSVVQFDADVSQHMSSLPAGSAASHDVRLEYHLSFYDSSGVVGVVLTPPARLERQPATQGLLSWRYARRIRLTSATPYAEVTKHDGTVLTTSPDVIARFAPAVGASHRGTTAMQIQTPVQRAERLRALLRSFVRREPPSGEPRPSVRSRSGLGPVETANWSATADGFQILTHRAIEYVNGSDRSAVRVSTTLTNARLAGSAGRLLE
jgi:uncharacterized protein YcfL